MKPIATSGIAAAAPMTGITMSDTEQTIAILALTASFACMLGAAALILATRRPHAALAGTLLGLGGAGIVGMVAALTMLDADPARHPSTYASVGRDCEPPVRR